MAVLGEGLAAELDAEDVRPSPGVAFTGAEHRWPRYSAGMRAAACLAIAFALAACGSSSSPSPAAASPAGPTGSTGPSGPTGGGGPIGAGACGATLDAAAGAHALKTVFVVLLENKDWSQIEGSASAPYINGTLLPRFAHATDYRNGGLHPSLPSYIELEAGNPLGVTQDIPPAQAALPATCHLASLLEETGLGWKAYQEGISGAACPIQDQGSYAVRHDPFVYFPDVSGSPPSAAGATCIAHVRPYSELAGDLQSGAVARYSFISPDLCHSGHDSCAPTYDPVRQEDDWLSAEIPKIQASQAWKRGGVILILWDEGSSGDPPIGLIAVSPLARQGYAGTAPYPTHATTLRTVEEILGIQPYLRSAATAPALSDLFVSYP